MNPTRQASRITWALFLNAGMLLLILIALVSHDGRLLPDSAAMAQQISASTPSLNSARSMSVMPAQLSPQHWGCYVIDGDNQTLSVYEYSPGEQKLRLAAARDIQYDRHLGYFNTAPAPSEIKEMIERAQEPPRAVRPITPAPETTQP
jgi:hypothetical protein